MGKCKFQPEWMDREDCSGHKISIWAKNQGDGNLLCKVCEDSISVAKGFYAIKQHYETEKHKNNFTRKNNVNQLRISNIDVANQGIKLHCLKDSSYSAELIWCLKIVAGNVSANFSQDIACVFKAMFPSDGAVPEKFSLNPTKVRYLMTDALGPYFKNQFLREMKTSYFTLMFDETTNHAGCKELQTSVRFWCNDKNEVVSHHLETFYMGHATAENLKNNIITALDNANLLFSNLIMVGCDGPYVNQKVFSLLNEEMKAIRGKGLVDIGYCNIHMIHNAFQKGLQVLGFDASELIISIYRYFKDWPSRKEDFAICQNKKGLPNVSFLKHVSSRWLTIEPAAARLLEQWDAVMEYFFKFIPMHQTSHMKSNSYKQIASLLKKTTIKAELRFVCSSSVIFTKFTGLFQREEPLCHQLYHHIQDLVISLISRSCKAEAIEMFKKSPSDDVFKSEFLLPVKDIALSEDMKLLTAHLSNAEKGGFLRDVQNHYIAAGRYIIMKNENYSRILRSLSCIRPDQVKLKVSHKRIQILATYLPVPYDAEKLADEWKLVQLEKNEPSCRIDHFWSKLFVMRNTDGSSKYPTVTSVIKAALTLSHGNAEIERGFSRSARILTEDRSSMSVRVLNARMNIASGLKRYDNKPHLVPITEELLKAARMAYKSYESYLSSQRQKAEEEEKKKKEEENARILEEEKRKLLEQSKGEIEKLKNELEMVKKTEDVQNSAVGELLEEANEKLKKAIEKNNIAGVQVAQAMLEGAVKSNVQCNRKRNVINNLEKELNKKKDSVITSFFSKKPRNN